MGTAIMLNNLLHDFAVALLAAGLLVMWIASRPGLGVPEASLRGIYRKLSALLTGCWVVILLGGVVRTLAYREYEWLPAAGRGQVVALAVKHVILAAAVVLGLWGQFRLRRRLVR